MSIELLKKLANTDRDQSGLSGDTEGGTDQRRKRRDDP